MLALINDLFRHQAYADCELLKAIRQHEAALQDQRMRELLHHIVAVQRFFLFTCQGGPFDRAKEMQTPDTLDEVFERYRETHAFAHQWIATLQEADLQRRVEVRVFPGQPIAIWEALVQTCMHSHGHRAQCLMRLRELGGQPPTLDFILWTRDRVSAGRGAGL